MRLSFLERKSPITITNLAIENISSKKHSSLHEVVTPHIWELVMKEFEEMENDTNKQNYFFAAADAELVSQATGYKLTIPLGDGEAGLAYVQSLARKKEQTPNAIKGMARVRQLYGPELQGLNTTIYAHLLAEGNKKVQEIRNLNAPSLEDLRFLTDFFTAFPGHRQHYSLSDQFFYYSLNKYMNMSIHARLSLFKHVILLSPHSLTVPKQPVIDEALEELQNTALHTLDFRFLDLASNLAVVMADGTKFNDYGIQLEYTTTQEKKENSELPPIQRSF